MPPNRSRTPGTNGSLGLGGFPISRNPPAFLQSGIGSGMADTTAPPPGKANYARSGGLTALIFLPPALMLFTIFVILPIGEAGWYGFYNWNGLAALENFVGLQNYKQLLAN